LLPALKGLPLFVSAGDGRGTKRDAIEAEVGAESRAFARRARALHVPLHAELYPGGTHDWPYWQRELHRSLPLLLGPLR
jgi:S-formylglutathione hydrolase FrmB